jgi:hypothetical protein
MKLAALIVLAGALTLSAAASPSPSPVPMPVKTDPALLEQSPAASGDYLAWAQSPATKVHFDVFAQVRNGRPFRVNTHGTQGRPGGISGRTLVYQQWRGGRSDIGFFELVKRTRLKSPHGVNTPRWESRPSLSGRWLLFNRRNPRTKVELVLLRNLRTGKPIVLDRARPPDQVLVQQLAGNFAVWTSCRFRCAVRRYDLATAQRVVVQQSGIPEATDYAASVLRDGTIYFVRGDMFSNSGGPPSATLLRYTGKTTQDVVARFEGARPTALYASTGRNAPDVYFDTGPCAGGRDIYRIVGLPAPAPR